jgi:hypothetical protein
VIKFTVTGRAVHFPFGRLPPVGFVYDTEHALERGKRINRMLIGVAMALMGVTYTLARAEVIGGAVFWPVLIGTILAYTAAVWLALPKAARYDAGRDGALADPRKKAP